MFQSLSDRLSGVLDKLTRRGALTESDVGEAMREVRRALLEADVALDVVRDFVEKVKAKAIGQEVLRSVTPGQMVVKIVNDELVAMLGSDAPADRPARGPARRHHDGRPAGLRQDDDDGEDRLAPHRPRQEESPDGVARHAAPGCAGAAARARRADRASTRCRSLPGRRRSRSPSAPSMRRGSAATTSCCSTRPAASTSTKS